MAESNPGLERALGIVDSWPAPTVAVAALVGEGSVTTRGPLEQVLRWASVTKLITAYAVLVAVEEGVIDLDEAAGPDGSTVRHVLAHASGLAFEDGDPVGRPGRMRIYSNSGYATLGELLETRAEMPFETYVRAAVLEPLGMGTTVVRTDEPRQAAAAGLYGTLADLVVFTRELRAPKIIARETLAEATSVQFPGLAGVLPGFGRQDPCDWGLGFELRGAKSPHWTGSRNSPGTFGHFGGSGAFVWIDPDAGVALACLTDLEVGPWALAAWPALADAVLAAVEG